MGRNRMGTREGGNDEPAGTKKVGRTDWDRLSWVGLGWGGLVCTAEKRERERKGGRRSCREGVVETLEGRLQAEKTRRGGKGAR